MPVDTPHEGLWREPFPPRDSEGRSCYAYAVNGGLREIWEAYIFSGAFSNDDSAARSTAERLNPSAEYVLQAYFSEPPAEVRTYVDEMNRPYDHAPSADEVWRSFLARVLLWLGERWPTTVTRALMDIAERHQLPDELAAVLRTLGSL